MIKWITCSVCMMCAAIQFCSAAEQTSIEEQAKTAYEDGQRLELQCKWEEAVQAYKVASAKCPDQVEYKLNQATAYKHLAKWDEVIKCYSEAIALKPENAAYKDDLASARNEKANDLARKGLLKASFPNASGERDLKGAIADYRAALEIKDDPMIRANLINALLELGYREDANLESFKNLKNQSLPKPSFWKTYRKEGQE